MNRIANIVAASVIALACATSAAARPAIDFGILGEPTTADTNEFSGLQPTPQSDLNIFRAFETRRPKALSDPHTSMADRIDTTVVFIGYQRALFYAAVSGAPQLVTPNDWKLIRHDEFALIGLTCGGQTRAAARYGLTNGQCDAWVKANRMEIDRMHRRSP